MRNIRKSRKKITFLTAPALMLLLLASCGLASEGIPTVDESTVSDENSASGSESAGESVAITNAAADGMLDTSDLFSTRDMTQSADLSGAKSLSVSSGKDLAISDAGVYVLSGSAKNSTVYIEAASDDKIQLVLDGLSIENDDFPAIYIKNADKVFITTTDSQNSLSVSGSFRADGDTNTDGVIFSKDDLVLNGVGTLAITSSAHGVVSKDDLKVTGGSYVLTTAKKAFQANDSIRVSGGNFDITAGTDGFHAKNDYDDSLGYIYVSGGSFNINAGDDGIHATSILQIDGGDMTIKAVEGLEATYVQINGGNIDISASDDGINAARKSSAYSPTVEINGGNIKIAMGAGDTDGIDSNGDIIVNGGTIDVTGNSTFDYEGKAELNGGTIIVNGEEVDTIPNQFMGGRGGFGGGFGGFGGQGGRQFDGEEGQEFEGRGGRGFPGGDFEPPQDGDFTPPEGGDGQGFRGGRGMRPKQNENQDDGDFQPPEGGMRPDRSGATPPDFPEGTPADPT